MLTKNFFYFLPHCLIERKLLENSISQSTNYDLVVVLVDDDDDLVWP